MDSKITYQKLTKENEDEFVLAEKYYSIISVLNNLHLTEREVQLVAFTAIRGNISDLKFRKEFCKRCNSSSATIYNMTSRLKALGVLVKADGKTKVNPVLVLKFEQNVVLNIKLSHEKKS